MIVQTSSQGTIYPVKPSAYLLKPCEHELTFEDIQPITLLSLSPFWLVAHKQNQH